MHLPVGPDYGHPSLLLKVREVRIRKKLAGFKPTIFQFLKYWQVGILTAAPKYLPSLNQRQQFVSNTLKPIKPNQFGQFICHLRHIPKQLKC